METDYSKLTLSQCAERVAYYTALLVEKSLEEIDQSGNQRAYIYLDAIDVSRKVAIETTLAHCKGNQSKAADYLGINRATLRTHSNRFNLLGDE
jgi:DNA-binding protein Fis